MAHTHHCAVCNEVVAHCGDGECQNQGDQHCSAHHPDPEFYVEDKPTVRMTVAIAKESENK